MLDRAPKRQAWLLVLLSCGAAIAARPHAQQIGRTPVEVRVPQPPTPVTALGRVHLVYELHVTNFGASAVTFEQLEVSSGDGLGLANWGAPQLTQRVILVGGPPGDPIVSGLSLMKLSTSA